MDELKNEFAAFQLLVLNRLNSLEERVNAYSAHIQEIHDQSALSEKKLQDLQNTFRNFSKPAPIQIVSQAPIPPVGHTDVSQGPSVSNWLSKFLGQ